MEDGRDRRKIALRNKKEISRQKRILEKFLVDRENGYFCQDSWHVGRFTVETEKNCLHREQYEVHIKNVNRCVPSQENSLGHKPMSRAREMDLRSGKKKENVQQVKISLDPKEGLLSRITVFAARRSLICSMLR